MPAYQALASLKPDENVWKRFYESIKPAAYAIDSTDGTTPIYQDIPNLKDAKSAYGAIVYSKAPAVLKQLAFVLGQESFRGALRLYLKGPRLFKRPVERSGARSPRGLGPEPGSLGGDVDPASRHAPGGRGLVL